MRSFDGSSDALQEGSNVLLGRLDEQFPVGISAHILPEPDYASITACGCRFEIHRVLERQKRELRRL